MPGRGFGRIGKRIPILSGRGSDPGPQDLYWEEQITPVIGLSAMRSTASEARVNRYSSSEQLLAAQLRLLYGNANLGVVVNIVAAAILGALQWGIVSKPKIIAWCLYITLVSIGRYAFARRYWHTSSTDTDLGRWRTIFIIGVGCAGAGWGAAGVLLYPPGHLTNQV